MLDARFCSIAPSAFSSQGGRAAGAEGAGLCSYIGSRQAGEMGYTIASTVLLLLSLVATSS